MNYNVFYTENFRKDAKRLAKKHSSLKRDIEILIGSLEKDPVQGKPLGKDCFKIRMAISSKRKGKSGGARVITCVLIEDTEVYLLAIYDKSEKEDIPDKELKMLRNQVGL